MLTGYSPLYDSCIKLLLDVAKTKNIQVKLIDIRTQNFNPETFSVDFDVALERSVSTTKGDYAIHFLENLGIPVVNSSAVAKICGDKFLTSLALQKAKVATPKFAMVFTLEQAVQAINEIGGFPVVIKPAGGSYFKSKMIFGNSYRTQRCFGWTSSKSNLYSTVC
jgi:[lysine-biosynthesis-protein LysW]--L-2-aminoadipate ligase